MPGSVTLRGRAALALALVRCAGSDRAEVEKAFVPQELVRLVESLPLLHARHPDFVVRELHASPEGLLGATSHQWFSNVAAAKESSGLEAERCVLLDIYTAPPPPQTPSDANSTNASRLDVTSLHRSPHNLCNFRILWARGRGGALDWMPLDSDGLCGVYDALLVEDEYLLHRWRDAPPPCRIAAVDPNEASQHELGALPWTPGGRVPLVTVPLVSFQAFTGFSQESERNRQRWLMDPDLWNPYFLELVQQGRMHLCMKEHECEGDDLPFRLMFWDDISTEFVDCITRGVTPVYFLTPAIAEYTERNVILAPYHFQTPEDMAALVQHLSSSQGILELGTKMYMQRQSNWLLASLYWRQDARIRVLLTASSAFQQGTRKLPGALSQPQPPARADAGAEVVVCVTSSPGNHELRGIVRSTWGREGHVLTPMGTVSLRVLFFMADGVEARDEFDRLGDVVILRQLQESFGTIWLKTAAILKFGADYFQGRLGGTAHGPPLRYLMKCDDDAFLDIDAVVADILMRPPVGLFWGHLMALVEPNREEGHKYFVPTEVYPTEFYPPYARGMAYALSEDLVSPMGAALHEGSVEPFPYREDVSVGLYLLALARKGTVRVTPRQRKDAMPIDFNEHCTSPDAARPLLVLHRFLPGHAACFWRLLEQRRASGQLPPPMPPQSTGAGAPPLPPMGTHPDFCSCVASAL